MNMSDAATQVISAVRVSLTEAPGAAAWMREQSGGTLRLLAHFWERLPQASRFLHPDLHLVFAMPDGRRAAGDPLDWTLVHGAMLYVPHAHRAEVFSRSAAGADALSLYISGWERLLRPGEGSGGPITTDNRPVPLQFLTGDAETVGAMLPQMLTLVKRRAPAREITNYVMVLPGSAAVMEDSNVRAARMDDEPVLNRWRRLYSHERGILFDSNISESIRSNNMFVYEQGGQIVTVAKFDVDLPEHVEIGGVFTFPEFRSKGYGRAMMGDLAARIRKNGKTPMLQVDEQNTVAHRLYLQLGWVDAGRLCRVWLVP